MNKKLKLDELERISVEEFRKAPKTPVYVILDDIRSLNNIGSVFRTSDAFRVKKIFLCGITAKPPHREIQKTALGATESVDWEYKESVIELVNDLKKKSIQIIAIEQAENKVFLNEFEDLKTEIAIVLGNEVNGVSQEVIQLADVVVEIPQFGTKHSFNIAVTAGIVLWDLYNKIEK